MLPRDKPEPGGEIAPSFEDIHRRREGLDRQGRDRADARHRLQTPGSFLRMQLPEPSLSQVWKWFSTTLRSDPERHAPVPRREAEAMSFDPRPPLQELLHSPAPAQPR